MSAQPPFSQQPAFTAPSPAEAMAEPRYRSLRIIATLLTIVGWVVIVAGGIGVVVFGIYTASAVGGAQALLSVVLGALYVAGFALYAFAGAAFIRLAVSVEANTRLTAEALARRPG